ncbi:TPA: hypothetical protein WHD72_000714 [Neisseria meningitidis]
MLALEFLFYFLFKKIIITDNNTDNKKIKLFSFDYDLMEANVLIRNVQISQPKKSKQERKP